MSPLKEAVLHHQHDTISSIVRSGGADAKDTTLGAQMFTLAASMGNCQTIARVARLLYPSAPLAELESLLRRYLVLQSSNYFGGGSKESAAKRAWSQAILGIVAPFSKDEPDFVLGAEQSQDLRFLFGRLGIKSEQALVEFVARA